jgi:hypothetical protein
MIGNKAYFPFPSGEWFDAPTAQTQEFALSFNPPHGQQQEGEAFAFVPSCPDFRSSLHLAAPSRPAAHDHSVTGGERFDVGGILGRAGNLHAAVADVQFIPDDVEVRLVALKQTPERQKHCFSPSQSLRVHDEVFYCANRTIKIREMAGHTFSAGRIEAAHNRDLDGGRCRD